jgi:hypothetical protein
MLFYVEILGLFDDSNCSDDSLRSKNENENENES